MTLSNMAKALLESGRPREAVEGLSEAITIYGELSEDAPAVYRSHLATASANQAVAAWTLGDNDLARAAAHSAVRIAEGSGVDSRSLFLMKGNTGSAYRILLEQWHNSSDQDRVFRCLNAMREAHVRALDEDPAQGLEEAARGLKEASQRTGRELEVLIAQSVHGAGLLLGVLRGNGPDFLVCEPAGEFRENAVRLFDEIVRVFDVRSAPSPREVRQRVRSLGEAAWQSLPGFAQSALDPAGAHDVLISGDESYSVLPWEALVFGKRQGDWLGLHRPLARWGPLTRSAFGKLRPGRFGGGRKRAAILCPWDAVVKNKLPAAKQEGEEVARQLKSLQYDLVPDGCAAFGNKATPTTLNGAITEEFSILHYTGHGSVLDGEEVLMLADEGMGALGPKVAAPFGRREIRNLSVGKDPDAPLLRGGPLVVLNSCRTGRQRSFGGQREDLTWALLEQGAEAVIACALPVFDKMGEFFGKYLYTLGLSGSPGTGVAFCSSAWVVGRLFPSAGLAPVASLDPLPLPRQPFRPSAARPQVAAGC